jgi:hypothetical protein
MRSTVAVVVWLCVGTAAQGAPGPSFSAGNAEITTQEVFGLQISVQTDEPLAPRFIFGVEWDPEMLDLIDHVTDGFLQLKAEISLFIRGDSNGDETVDLSDTLTTLGFLFQGSRPPTCYDANDDAVVEVSDALKTLNSVFQAAGPLPPPTGTPGEDPTPDGLGCLFTQS